MRLRDIDIEREPTTLDRVGGQILDRIGAFIVRYRGLPVLVGAGLVALNFIVQFFPFLGILARYHVFLHLGIIVGFLGLLLGEAL